MKIIGYVKKMMVLLLCLSVIGVNELSVFANNVVVKADTRSKTEFFPYSFQAEDYLERCSVSEKLFKTISPSQTMYDAGAESGLAVSAAVWDSFTTLLDSLNKPSSMADKAFEKKDLYAGLLLSIFECEYKSDTKARMDMSQIKNMNSLYKQFDSFCKANDYIYAASDKILFSDMSQVQKERLLSLTNTLADTDKDGDVWMSAMGNVDKALKVMDVLNDVEKWCTYIMNCILLNDLNENTKLVLKDMYQESLKTGNLDMSLAFKESLDIAQASGVELASEITEHFALEFTKKAAQEIIDTFWGDIKKSAQAANPYIAAFWLAYDGSKLLVKLVFNSDNITEKYCKMDALLQIRKVASAVYEKEKNTYKSTKNESDAAALIASRDIMYECINVDCECASEYVDSVSNALWQKIITLFKECNNLTELKRQIKSIQDSINSTHKTVQLNWIFWLQDDYPEEYENYKSLLVDYLPSVTMPKTSASVNVGEKIDLGGYVLSDPCKFLDGKIKESWSTTNSKVAMVNSMGVVSAVEKGTAVIKLRFLDSDGNEIDGIYQDCTVTVINQEIQLSKSSITIYRGESYTLKAAVKGNNDKVTWSTNKPSVANVTNNGKVTARKAGTAVITAKVSGIRARCKVTVKNASITLDKASYTMNVGDTYILKANVMGTGKKVMWSSNKPAVATVSNGKVIARKMGTATIIAKANGITAKCKVTVAAAAKNLQDGRYLIRSNTIGYVNTKSNNWEISAEYYNDYWPINMVYKGVCNMKVNAKTKYLDWYTPFDYNTISKKKFVSEHLKNSKYKWIFFEIRNGTINSIWGLKEDPEW